MDFQQWKEMLSLWRDLYKCTNLRDFHSKIRNYATIQFDAWQEKQLEKKAIDLWGRRSKADEYMLSGLEEWTALLVKRYGSIVKIALL